MLLSWNLTVTKKSKGPFPRSREEGEAEPDLPDMPDTASPAFLEFLMVVLKGQEPRPFGVDSDLGRGFLFFGAFWMDVRILTFCQRMSFPLNH